MLNKIRYRVVFNKAGKLNSRGEGLVHIAAFQRNKSCYFSTKVYLAPNQFKDGLVINHPNKNALNVYLLKTRHEIESTELDYFVKGVTPTLSMIKAAVKEHLTPSAKLSDFGEKAVKNSDRKKKTIDGYKTLFNNLKKFRKDVLLSDIDYNFICKYDAWLKAGGIAHNTRVGRLRQLKALLNEAVKREVISRNPFDRFKIPSMINKKGYINESQLEGIENLDETSNVNMYVRDAFLFCCYCGLRISDLLTLESKHIQDGWVHKTMVKTGFEVHIPIAKLFGGKALNIIRKYGKIERLVNKLGGNNVVNKDLKRIFELVGASDKFTFHTSRHTFATLLLNKGVAITSVQKMLGHTKVSTTQIYGEVTKETIENDLLRSLK